MKRAEGPATTLRLTEICDLAHRFVPSAAVDERLHMYGHRSWWPAHEIGHFLVATRSECRKRMFNLDLAIGLDHVVGRGSYHYAIAKEIAAISVSQRLLRRAGHAKLANEEIEFTDEDTLDCSHETWCKRAVRALLRKHRIKRLPTTFKGLEALLTRKAAEVETKTHASRQAAVGRNHPQ